MRLLYSVNLLVFIFAFQSCSRSKDNDNGEYLRAKAPLILDETGRSVLLRGVNLSNDNKFPNENGNFMTPWIGPETFNHLKSFGFDHVRLLIVWEAVEPEPGIYDLTYLEWIVQVVRWAAEAGLYVVVDMHQDLYSRKFSGDGAPFWAVLDGSIPFTPFNPWFLNYVHPAVVLAFDNFWKNEQSIRDRFALAWREVAMSLRDVPAVVGYDILNEPYPGSMIATPDRFDIEWLSPFYSAVTGKIREVDPNHIIFIEPSALRTNSLAPFGFPSALTRPDEENLGFAPHLYDPATTLTGSWDGKVSRLDDEVSDLESEAQRLSATPWVGEWSVWDYNVTNGEAFLRDQLDVFDSHLFGWSFWEYNLSDPRSPFNEDSENSWMLKYLNRPYPVKTAGVLISLSYNPDSGIFRMSYIPSNNTSLQTEVYLPQAVYGNNYEMDSTSPLDWSFDENNRHLHIKAVNPEKQVDIIIRP